MKNQKWSINDLKMMMNFHSIFYHVIIEKSIFDEAACEFKTKLIQFIVYWRQATQRLLNIIDENGDDDAWKFIKSDHEETRKKSEKYACFASKRTDFS